jgi:hypothetical protein
MSDEPTQRLIDPRALPERIDLMQRKSRDRRR